MMFLITKSQRSLLGRGQGYCTEPYNTQNNPYPVTSTKDYAAQVISHKKAENNWPGELFSSGCVGTHCVDTVVLKCTEIHLLLPSWD